MSSGRDKTHRYWLYHHDRLDPSIDYTFQRWAAYGNPAARGPAYKNRPFLQTRLREPRIITHQLDSIHEANGVASILILKTTNPLGLKMKMHTSYQHLLNLA